MSGIRYIVFILFIAFCFPYRSQATVPGLHNISLTLFGDSIRSEVYKNQRVIIYRVSAKETLYAVARKYKMKPAVLIAFNDNIQNLRTGDEIKIPRGIVKSQSEVQNNDVQNNDLQHHQEIKSAGSAITHTVVKGETLYSISKKYGMHVDELIQLNSLANKPIKTGQTLNVKTKKISVPVQEKSDTAKRPALETTGNSAVLNKPLKPEQTEAIPKDEKQNKKLDLPSTGLYIVQPHETLYSIASRYSLSLADLRQLNNLTGDDIHAGQTLKLRAGAGEPLSRIPGDSNKKAKSEGAANPAENKNTNNTNSDKKKIEPSVPPIVAPKADVIFTPEDAEHKDKHVSKEYREEGMGTWLNNTDLNQARSVALHHAAPVGTILKVTNPASRKSIFVKVVGNFQENADNKNAIVIISKSAADLIGAVNQNFRVELSYAY